MIIEDKKYPLLRNKKITKWILSIIIIFLINFITLINYSTNYIQILSKINSEKTMLEIKKMIIPILSNGKNQYIYLPFGNWKEILRQTPNLTEKLHNQILWTFIFSLIFLTLPYWKRKKETSHGEAEWGTYEDLKKKRWQPSDVNFLSGNDNGVVIGFVKTLTGKIKLLYDTSFIHISMFIPTRGGKGTGYLIPTLVAGLKKLSAFISDIKKENYALTSWYRAKIMKQIIYKFEPIGDLSNGYNFLSEIRYGTTNEIKDCRIIGNNIVGDSGKDPFWGDSAKDIISTLTMYAHYKELSNREEKNPSIFDVRANLNDVISVVTNTENSLYKLFAKYLGKDDDGEDILDLPEEEYDFLLKESTVEQLRKIYTDDESQRALNKRLHPFIAKQFGYLLQNTSETTFKSISATAKTKLQVFEIPNVVKNISKSDFKAMDLVNSEKPVSLYFVIAPEDLELLAPLVRVMYVQLTNILMGSLEKKKHNIVFLMDELNSYGKMNDLIKGLGYYAGYGIKIVGIFQGLAQMNATYKEEGKSLLAGCQIQIFGRPNDDEGASYVSKTLGKKTIRIKNNGKIFEKGTAHGRELLTESEVKQLSDRKAITLTGYKKPLLLDKLYYYEHKELLERTQHQPVFFKDGYVIFEGIKTERAEYKHTFKMTIDEFYNEEIYNKKINELRKKYKNDLIA